MIHRDLKPSKTSSFFLFGPRGTGKSTWLRGFSPAKNTLFVDLLDPQTEDSLFRNPNELKHQIEGRKNPPAWVVVDEVQKVPRLLDVVHGLIEGKGTKFALTGSSARKLKRGVSNLLAGRAFVYQLFPFTEKELGDDFDLKDALTWGTLPRLVSLPQADDKAEYLRAYALTYLKEEIASEQVVRWLPPFRNFLGVAAQCSGQVINFTKVARDVGVDTKTVQSYFEILEDTLMGISLPAFHLSVRKRQRSHPKFYFFDTGVKRALDRTLDQELYPRTFAWGFAFEHWIINEIHRRVHYARKDWTFSYLQTTDGGEIDLIVDRPGLSRLLVEIKSTDLVEEKDVACLNRLTPDIPNGLAFCLSLDPTRKKIGEVTCLFWRSAFDEWGL